MFVSNDVDEAQKNLSRQISFAGPANEFRLRNAEMKPKLFITANNFRGASQCTLVNILKHHLPLLAWYLNRLDLECTSRDSVSTQERQKARTRLVHEERLPLVSR